MYKKKILLKFLMATVLSISSVAYGDEPTDVTEDSTGDSAEYFDETDEFMEDSLWEESDDSGEFIEDPYIEDSYVGDPEGSGFPEDTSTEDTSVPPSGEDLTTTDSSKPSSEPNLPESQKEPDNADVPLANEDQPTIVESTDSAKPQNTPKTDKTEVDSTMVG